MKIAIYTICKNEKKYISRFLKRSQTADYICLLDTGSADGTWEYLQKKSKTEKFKNKLKIEQKLFSNFRFDTARNAALTLVPEDTDFCIKLDIDEYLSENWYCIIQNYLKANQDSLPEHFIGAITYKEFKVKKYGLKELTRDTYCACFHPYEEGWSWCYPVHEDLKYLTSVNSVVFPDVEITHTPKTDSGFVKAKVNFYNSLLQQRYKEYPDDLMSHYQQVYTFFQNDFETAPLPEIHQGLQRMLEDLCRVYDETSATGCSLEFKVLFVFALFAYANRFSHEVFEELKKLYSLTLIQFNNSFNVVSILSLKQQQQYQDLKEYFSRFPSYSLIQTFEQTGQIDLREISNIFVRRNGTQLNYHILREDLEEIQLFLKSREAGIQEINPSFATENQTLLNKAERHLQSLSGIVRSLEIINPLQGLGIEVLCTSHCNLNCAYCNHFAPLAPQENYSSQSYQQDLEQLKRLFPHEVYDIKLMGGEPLLNPELIQFILLSRKYFPEAQLSILTNGLLLLAMSEEFWKVCTENQIKISVTPYSLLDKAKILELGQKKQVQIDWYPDSMNNPGEKCWMEKFCVNPQGTTKVTRKFLDCGNANKTLSLRDGYLYTCPFKATVKFFNQAFGYNLPVDPDLNGVNLKQATRAEALLFLCNPTELCKYCYGECGPVLWRKSTRKKEEWLLDSQHNPRYLENACFIEEG